MYKSREHFEYGNMHIAIDAYTGEILEIFSKRNYDNILKNSMYDIHQPFKITVKNGDRVTDYFPLHGRVATRNAKMRVCFSTEKLSDGLCVKVDYPYVSNGETEIPANLSYTVIIRDDGLNFNLNLKNTFDGMITEVCFPVLPGIVLGADYSDDNLVFPKNGGAKFNGFVDALGKARKHSNWRWQEYRYDYTLDGIDTPGRLKVQKLKGVAGRYPGELCMSWMDLYDDDGGVYFGVHAPSVEKSCFLDAAGYGPEMPGVILGAATQPRIWQNEDYSTPPCVVVLHEGNWHEGAKIYRKFRQPLLEKSERVLPNWAKNSVGLVAHYDFKYQHGGIVHTYKDIPKLADEALATGFDHMLFSGWHLGGFDNGFPMYVTDPELGTEQEFIDGIAEAKRKGVHVTFYVNARLHNVKYNSEHIKEKIIVYDDEGHEKYSQFGNRDILFADMCPNSEQWINEVFEFSKRITQVYGADGIYFDVLSCGGGYCFNPLHNHGEIDSVTPGEIKTLKGVRKDFESAFDDTIMLMGEHVVDQVGNLMTFQLNQLWLTYISAYPEMYRYTFPEHGVVDMIYPNKNQVFRAPLISKASQIFMARLFTNGSYFWIYDLVDDCTFTRDEEGFSILKDLIKLRKIQLKRNDGYMFCDCDGLSCDDSTVMVRSYKNSNGGEMLACFRFNDDNSTVTLKEKIKKAVAVFADESERILPLEGDNKIILPNEKAYLIFIER